MAQAAPSRKSRRVMDSPMDEDYVFEARFEKPRRPPPGHRRAGAPVQRFLPIIQRSRLLPWRTKPRLGAMDLRRIRAVNTPGGEVAATPLAHPAGRGVWSAALLRNL